MLELIDCKFCGRSFERTRTDKRFCSAKCRYADFDKRKKAKDPTTIKGMHTAFNDALLCIQRESPESFKLIRESRDHIGLRAAYVALASALIIVRPTIVNFEDAHNSLFVSAKKQAGIA